MLIMDILNLSLKIVRNYENELLPMIHQNWHGLVRKMQKFQVYLTMNLTRHNWRKYNTKFYTHELMECKINGSNIVSFGKKFIQITL